MGDENREERQEIEGETINRLLPPGWRKPYEPVSAEDFAAAEIRHQEGGFFILHFPWGEDYVYNLDGKYDGHGMEIPPAGKDITPPEGLTL